MLLTPLPKTVHYSLLWLVGLPQVTQAALSASNLTRIESIPSLEVIDWAQGASWTEYGIDATPIPPVRTASTATLAKVSAEAIAPQSFESKAESRTDSWLKILQAYEIWRESKSFASAIVSDLEFIKVYNEQQLNLPNGT